MVLFDLFSVLYIILLYEYNLICLFILLLIICIVSSFGYMNNIAVLNFFVPIFDVHVYAFLLGSLLLLEMDGYIYSFIWYCQTTFQSDYFNLQSNQQYIPLPLFLLHTNTWYFQSLSF